MDPQYLSRIGKSKPPSDINGGGPPKPVAGPPTRPAVESNPMGIGDPSAIRVMSIIWSIWLPISSSLRTWGPISANFAKSTPPPEFIISLKSSRLRWTPTGEAPKPPPMVICWPYPQGPPVPMPISILLLDSIPGSAVPGTIPGNIPVAETLRFVGKLSMNILPRTILAPTCCSYAFTAVKYSLLNGSEGAPLTVATAHVPDIWPAACAVYCFGTAGWAGCTHGATV